MKKKSTKGYGFGTSPVFLAGISTILGAILFLRFGYAVGHTGVFGTILIILIGHAITIPTAMAIAEIATNLKVEGGGEYFIISRSFGSVVGGTIGISLYASQAISVAFYMIAFAEAFTPAFGWVEGIVGFAPQTWMISIPATVGLMVLMVFKGANIGVSALWAVVAILAVSLAAFFLGGQSQAEASLDIFAKVSDPDNFFLVFAIIFPAFTGMTAGVGLSGDLKNPRKSIPLGTMAATVVGMFVYILVVLKLGTSLSPDELVDGQFAMSKIALWGPIIPIGLGAAALSSAIGSILVAPRTLQALAKDNIIPVPLSNEFLSKGKKETNEPFNATLFTAVLVLAVVLSGNVNFVAKIISMFFMITYGSLCMVSFLEHFAGNPSYRPTFRSKWYISIIGAIGSFVMMFQMAPVYAVIAVSAMAVIYISIRRKQSGEDDLSNMIEGALFQLTRQLQVLIQRKQTTINESWRPSFIAISYNSFKRLAPFDLLRWISHYYGFGTFIHYIRGRLDGETYQEAKVKLDQLISQSKASKTSIYVDTVVSPSFKDAVAQIVQIPGISGMENNGILFEFHHAGEEELAEIIEGCAYAAIVDYNICVLRSSDHHFGYKKQIHIWLTPGDYRNANLMILMAYIILGNPEWKDCEVNLYVAFETKELNKELKRLYQLIEEGRIPISENNLKRIPWDRKAKSFENLVTENSDSADLVIMGFSVKKVQQEKGAFFKKFENVNEILFVRAGQKIAISEDGE